MADVSDDQIRELLATIRLEDFIEVTPAMAEACLLEVSRGHDWDGMATDEMPGNVLYAMLEARSMEMGIPPRPCAGSDDSDETSPASSDNSLKTGPLLDPP